MAASKSFAVRPLEAEAETEAEAAHQASLNSTPFNSRRRKTSDRPVALSYACARSKVTV